MTRVLLLPFITTVWTLVVFAVISVKMLTMIITLMMTAW